MHFGRLPSRFAIWPELSTAIWQPQWFPLPWIESDIWGQHNFTYLKLWQYPFVSPSRCNSTTLFQCNGGSLTTRPLKPGRWRRKCVPHKWSHSACWRGGHQPCSSPDGSYRIRHFYVDVHTEGVHAHSPSQQNTTLPAFSDQLTCSRYHNVPRTHRK